MCRTEGCWEISLLKGQSECHTAQPLNLDTSRLKLLRSIRHFESCVPYENAHWISVCRQEMLYVCRKINSINRLCYFHAKACRGLSVSVPPGRDPLPVLLAARWDWLCSSAGIQMCRHCRPPWSLLWRGAALSTPRPAGFAHRPDSVGSTSVPAATLPHLRDRSNRKCLVYSSLLFIIPKVHWLMHQFHTWN